MRIVTLNTDASWDPVEKVCGYAFYIKSDKFLIKRSGVTKERVPDAHEAESKCIANAIFFLKNYLEKEEIKDEFTLIVNTDSKYSIQSIENPKKPLYFLIRNIISGLNLKKFELRHVKAHTKNSDARSWVNNWCDQAAKRQMYKARELSRKENFNEHTKIPAKKKSGTEVSVKIKSEVIFSCIFGFLILFFN